jgi:hypothetical protein
MADYYGIIPGNAPDDLSVSAEGYSPHPLFLPERTAVEDWLFDHQGIEGRPSVIQ